MSVYKEKFINNCIQIITRSKNKIKILNNEDIKNILSELLNPSIDTLIKNIENMSSEESLAILDIEDDMNGTYRDFYNLNSNGNHFGFTVAHEIEGITQEHLYGYVTKKFNSNIFDDIFFDAYKGDIDLGFEEYEDFKSLLTEAVYNTLFDSTSKEINNYLSSRFK